MYTLKSACIGILFVYHNMLFISMIIKQVFKRQSSKSSFDCGLKVLAEGAWLGIP